jgi:hypothetical protein
MVRGSAGIPSVHDVRPALRYLHMNSVQENDRGWYMCQVTPIAPVQTVTTRTQINTDPMVHRSGYLEVVVPPKIRGSGPTDMVSLKNSIT